jgi:3-deoxy-manno-octulosonate cytidylyltransferase (CMP-KDO synthetase)|tara:strand:- start:503 stop:1243 length:741 start_codon:yes stop_codon:yes gene_type:complete
MQKTLILIPSRLSASRLPNKPLLKIKGKSIISLVVDKAKRSKLGEVIVATEDNKIFHEVKKNGGKAIITSNKHKTGTDRIYECLTKLNNKNIDYIINLQGDEPNIDINDLKSLYKLVKKNNSDMATLASEISNRKIYKDKNIVKVITHLKLNKNNFPFAKNFKRLINPENNIYHHLGVYIYKVEILKKFINLRQSKNELKNKLEQMRAIDNGIKINVALASKPSIGIDTMEDYVALKKIMEYKSSI